PKKPRQPAASSGVPLYSGWHAFAAPGVCQRRGSPQGPRKHGTHHGAAGGPTKHEPRTFLMWLVNAALRRPYSVWVGMLLVVVLGMVSYAHTPTDILPNLKVPVVVVFASYRGMPAPDMEQSVTSILERALTHCDHLEHIESRSLLGIGIIKVYFRPEVDPDIAASQVVSLVNGEMQNLPPGMLPPSILKYDASAIPVGNLIISSNTRDDKYLLD